jgi:hypothetical protein
MKNDFMIDYDQILTLKTWFWPMLGGYLKTLDIKSKYHFKNLPHVKKKWYLK